MEKTSSLPLVGKYSAIWGDEESPGTSKKRGQMAEDGVGRIVMKGSRKEAHTASVPPHALPLSSGSVG